ncbi:MAG: hypothetical protein HQM11_18795 [SAR324 cluster bacterium]|nr:hypothetical protein [SAR324 cluster bacterium]
MPQVKMSRYARNDKIPSFNRLKYNTNANMDDSSKRGTSSILTRYQ